MKEEGGAECGEGLVGAGRRRSVPGSTAAGWGRRSLGFSLLVLSLAPVYRLLDHPQTGRFGEGTLRWGEANLEAAWWGILVAAVLGAALFFLVSPTALRGALGVVAARSRGIPTRALALVASTFAMLLALTASRAAFQGFPTLLDEMAALLHGRILASGRLALPLPEPQAGWLVANTLMTAEGWTSQYPLFQPLLLAGGFLVGTPWLVGPLSLGLTVGLGVLVAHHLLPGRPGTVRLAGLLLACSPFLVFLGGGYLSHVPAAALVAFVVWAALQARDRGWGWGVLVGAGAGALVGARPWTGLVMGVVFPAALWLAHAHTQRSSAGRGRKIHLVCGSIPWLARRMGAALLGGLPFAMAWGYVHNRLFGSPAALGYALAYGPSHDLGFHRDPWGNLYGPLEALGYTSADLITLGVYLLETAVPAVPLAALHLLLAPRIPKGTWVLWGWALLPVAANFFYWHHGFHLGPRMLYEAAPAWVILTALAAVELSGGGKGGPRPHRCSSRGRPSRLFPVGGRWSRVLPRWEDWLLGALLVSAVSFPFLSALRFSAHRWNPETLARIRPPTVAGGEPSLVFVHGSWEERISARLQASGMRLDSIETALRRNDICLLHTLAVARAAGDSARADALLSSLDFRLLPDTPPHLTRIQVVEGEDVLVDPTLPPTPDCLREARADRHGLVSLAPLVWQGDLPGIEEGRPMFVRDLGPEANEPLLRAFPHRRPYLYTTPPGGGPPRLFSYKEGLGLLWGDTPAPAEVPRAAR